MKVILVILATLGSVDLDRVEWLRMPRLMRKDIKRYYKLERKEIRKDERVQKKNDRLYDEQGFSRSVKSSRIA